MLWFENDRTGDMICMETTILGDLRIQTVFDSGFYLYQKKRDTKAHSHLNYELYFIESGICKTWCDGDVYSCSKGDLLLIPIGAEHNVQYLSEDASLYSFRFSFYPVTERKDALQVYHQLLVHMESALQFHQQECLTLLQQLRWELAQLLPLCSEKIHGLLQVFYAEFLRRFLLTTPLSVSPQTFSIILDPSHSDKLPGYRKDTPQEYYIDILDEFFTHLPLKKPTLADLANRLHLSISQTQRLIKNRYGISFQQKLIKAKIEQSKRLIATTQLSLEAISERVGYSSYNAFFEAFSSQT